MKNIGPTAKNIDIKYHIHMYVTKGADTLIYNAAARISMDYSKPLYL